MKKQDALDAYISGARKMQMRPSARAEMLRKLNDPQIAEQYSEQAFRAHKRQIAWLRFERWSGMAAVLLVGFSFGILVHTAVTQQPDVQMPIQYTDEVLGEYFSHYGYQNPGIIPSGDYDALLLFSHCRIKQVEALHELQLYEEELGIEKAPCNLLIWDYVKAAVIQGFIMQQFSQCEPNQKPVKVFDFAYSADDPYLYFLIANTSDSDISYNTDVLIANDTQTFHVQMQESAYNTDVLIANATQAFYVQMQESAYQRSWIAPYLNGTFSVNRNTGACTVTIPAHGAIQIAAEIPSEIDLGETRWSMSFYAPDTTQEAVLTAVFVLDAELQISHAEEHRLLSAAAAADPTFQNP